MRYNLLSFLLLTLVFVSCGQIPDPLRNRIELTDDIGQVSDSIVYLESLLKKLPESQIVSSFIDNEGHLYVNTKKLGRLTNSLQDSSMRSDPVFLNFTDSDYRRFISITIFLLKNHIDSSMKDNRSGFFVHGYRETEENRYVDIRDIMVNVDTTSPKFVKQYQILDRKENMVLVAPIDIEVR